MRIQEMRSGLVHLPKKTDEVDIDEIFRRVETELAPLNEVVSSELDQPIWAVISFDEVRAQSLIYREAVMLIEELDHLGIPGLCIVTDQTAARTLK